MGALGRRPRDLRIPSEQEVVRRLTSTTGVVFVVFLVVGWIGMTSAASLLGGGVGVGLIGTLLLTAYGGVLGFLLFRASQRELALIRTLSIFLGEAPIGIVFLDQEGRLAYANAAIERLTGRTLREAAGHPVGDLVHPDDRLRLPRTQDVAGQGGTAARDIRLLRRDGTTAHTLITSMPFFDGDRYDGALAAILDVSELYGAREVAQRYRELSSFALDTVTHDLSNRMQELSARASVVSAVVPADAAAARKAVASLSQSAERAVRLIKEVKQIASAERDAWPKGPTAVGDLFDRALEVAVLPAGSKARAVVPPDVGTLQVDASDLAPLALSKLLEECGESAPRGAALPVAVEASVAGPGPDDLVVRVRGFAQDVSDEDLALMLAPPREMGARPTPWRAGLRLALASAVAQAHGWSLRAVRDGPGGAVVFEVRAPLVRP